MKLMLPAILVIAINLFLASSVRAEDHTDCNPERNITYCKGESLYIASECELKDANGDIPPGELKENCTAHNNSESDWHCKGDQGSAKCQREYQININITPAPSAGSLYLGEKYVIDVSGTKSCNIEGKSLKLVADGLVDTLKLQQGQNTPCAFTFTGCLNDEGVPCRWQANCIPTKMSKNDSDFFNLSVQAEGLSNCKAEVKYTVGARSCNLAKDSKALTDESGSDNNDLVGKSLNSSYVVTNAFNKALLPQELNSEIDQVKSEKVPEVGVQTGFLALIQNFACSVGTFLGVGDLSFCKTNVDLAAQKTEHFVKAATTLVNSERPSEIAPTPMKKSCYLEDITDTTSNQTTKGNEKLDSLSKSVGVNDGVYGLGLPDFSTSDSDLILDNSGSNLSIRKNVVQEDDRAPGIKCQEELYYQANYPEGIKPLYEVPKGASISSCIKKNP